MDDYLSKPIRIPELTATLERLWAERQRKRAVPPEPGLG